MSTIRKFGNALLIVLGVFLILSGILSAKINNPKFQTYLADKLVNYLSSRLNTEIKIGSVNFTLFQHLVLNDVLLKDQKKDTLLYSKTIDVTFGLIDLIQNHYIIKKISLDEPQIFLHNYLETDEFNFQFIIDAFSGDSMQSSGSKSSPFQLELNAVSIHRVHFVMLDEPNEVRLDFHIPQTDVDVKNLDLNKSIIDLRNVSFENADLKIAKLKRSIDPSDTMSGPDTSIVHINTRPIRLYVSQLHFVNSQFQFDDENEPLTAGQFDGFHQLYANLNMDFFQGSLVMDTVKAKIQNISFKEKSGFILKHMEADASVTPTASIANHLKIETANSVAGNFYSMSYVNFHAFLNYNSDVVMNTRMEQSSLSMKDIGYFIPQVNSISEKIITTGTFSGSVDNLKGKGLKLHTGRLTQFNGNIDVKGLPDLNATFIDFKIDQLITDISDVKDFIPAVTLPKEFTQLAVVTFRGSFTGFIKDFVAYGTLNSRIGELRSDLNMKFSDTYRNATYSGNLAAKEFNIGNYAGADSLLGKISFDAKLSGSGLTIDQLDAKMAGKVQQFQFNGYNYQNIEVDGLFTKKLFTGKVKMEDENVKLGFMGTLDLNEELPIYNFHAQIDQADLNHLNFTDQQYVLSTVVDMNMKGNNIDNFIGYAKAVKTTFTKSGQQIVLDTVLIDIFEQNNQKHFLVSSEPASAAFNGTFSLTKLPVSFLSVLDHYFPSLPMEYEAPDVIQDFDFDIRVKNAAGMLQFFFPNWSGISRSNIQGHFNSKSNLIAFNGVIPSLGYKSLFLDSLNVIAKDTAGGLYLSARSADMTIASGNKIAYPGFTARIALDTALINLVAANEIGNTYLNINSIITGDTAGLSLHLFPSALVLNNARWDISENNAVSYSDERLLFSNFRLSHDDQWLTVSNTSLQPRATNLHFDFNELPMGDLYHFVSLNGFDIGGNLSGNIDLLNVFHDPRLQCTALMNDLLVNQRSISRADLNLSYLLEDDQVLVDLLLTDSSYDVHGSGSYFPKKAGDPLKFNLDINKFDLSFFETLLPGYFSNTTGFATGKLLISGNAVHPLLTGQLTIPYLTAKVDYLQTTYHSYNTTVTFNKDNIDIGKMILYDENNDVANADGQIFHDHLDHFNFNLSVNTYRFEGLKTTEKDNTLFYGIAEAGGLVQFLGPLEDMEIRASLTSRHGTQISVPINSGTSVADRSFIRLVKKGRDSLNYSLASYEFIQGLRLNLDLDVTPDAEIKIIFDQKAGDIIRGNGNGNIRMEINTKGEFNMYGTFTISQGAYLFTLQNFFNKYFSIDRGGTIAWTGDPYGAQIDIDAIYSTKASVYDLVVGSVSTFTSDQEIRDLQRRIPVDVYLKLTGSLLLPDVSFDIQLPDETTLSSSAYQQVEKVKQDEGELNKQVFGLLILNRFLPSNSGSGNQSIGSDVNNSVSEFLLNQLSYWTSQIRSDVDVNFNYQSYEANLNTTNPNDLTKRNELEVALTKRFFNDRLALEAGGNFDFAGSNADPSAASADNTNSTNVAGDFSVEYKITPDGRLSGKAFSKSQYDVVDERYKTKNGVALSYKREFDKVRELFRRDPEKQKKKQERRLEKQQEQEIEKKLDQPSSSN